MTYTTPGGTRHSLYGDMLKQNHLLIAGATGSGKSVVINALIYTALLNGPGKSAFILCDPKMVELSRYRRLPHVLEYADTLEGIAEALTYAHDIMMARFSRMKAAGEVETSERDIHIIVDEFADLVTRGADREENKLRTICESKIESIGKLGRAAHVHLILATQAPNRKTIKANIVLNMTARVALRCEYPTESKQIIGQPWAVDLPDPKVEHRAEAYYKHGLELDLCNIPMIDPDEIRRVIAHWEAQKPEEPEKKKSIFKRLFKK